MVHTFFSSDKENERTTERVNVTHSTHRLGPANPNVTDRNLSNKELTASSRKKNTFYNFLYCRHIFTLPSPLFTLIPLASLLSSTLPL